MEFLLVQTRNFEDQYRTNASDGIADKDLIAVLLEHRGLIINLPQVIWNLGNTCIKHLAYNEKNQ